MRALTTRKTYSLFLVLLLVLSSLFFFPGNITAEVSKLDPSQIKTIDNFNSRNDRNEAGGLWKVHEGGKGGLKYRFKKDDALNDLRGSCLWITYKVPAKDKVFLETDLNNLDISQAKELRFWVKRVPEEKNRLQVVLGDGENRTSQLPVARYLSAEDERGWQEARIPIREFFNVDTGDLKTFRLVIKGGRAEEAEGSFFFDDLIFVGPKGLVFQSLADNLKGFPEQATVPNYKRYDLASKTSDQMLLEIAKMTWGYFDNLVDKKTHLVVDNIQVGKYPAIGDYTSLTNIGLYFMACVSAYELGFISREDAVGRIRNTLKSMKKMKQWNGFFYNFYNTTNRQVTRPYISTVDSGWLAAGMIVARKAFHRELSNDIDKMLDKMDFSIFYNDRVGQLRLGYDELDVSMSPFHYGLLATEARVTSYIAIAKGDVPEEHWYKIDRTPPAAWEWQTQKPIKREYEVNGEKKFQDMYQYRNYYLIPSWGGSMFEFLMPSLVLKEKELSPRGLGRNNSLATKAQMEYATIVKGYPVWGLSPCSYPGGYGEFGLKQIGAKGYNDFGVITPHASIIALEYHPKEVIENVRELLKHYPVLGEYGFYDSVKMRGRKRVTPKYLALDQGMILVSITNYLKRGVIRNYFHQDSGVRRAEHLLRNEKYF